jgi:hypothetical protein
MAAFDRDLVAKLHRRGIVVFAVIDHQTSVATPPGVDDEIDQNNFESGILSALTRSARSVPSATHYPAAAPIHGLCPIHGQTIAVVGAPGTGTSVVAAGLAQSFAQSFCETRKLPISADARAEVVLADLRRRPSQATIHELIDAHRFATLTAPDTRAFCFEVPAMGYDLLTGLRSRHLASTFQHPTILESLHSLANAYTVAVVEIDDEFDGEADTGSIDIEERNALARTTLFAADHVVVTGRASKQGLRDLSAGIEALISFGIPTSAIYPVVNFAPADEPVQAQIRITFERSVPTLENQPTLIPRFTSQADGTISRTDRIRVATELTPLRSTLRAPNTRSLDLPTYGRLRADQLRLSRIDEFADF